MRVPTWILAALAVVALAFVSAPPPATAQGGAKPVWEYKVFRLDRDEYKDKVDYQAILRKEGRRGAESVFYERVLAFVGKDGWDLVSVERRGPEVVYLYLKRRG